MLYLQGSAPLISAIVPSLPEQTHENHGNGQHHVRTRTTADDL